MLQSFDHQESSRQVYEESETSIQYDMTEKTEADVICDRYFSEYKTYKAFPNK